MLPLFFTRNNRENFDKCKLCTVRNIKKQKLILPEKNLCLPGTEGIFSTFPPPLHKFYSLHLIRNSCNIKLLECFFLFFFTNSVCTQDSKFGVLVSYVVK